MSIRLIAAGVLAANLVACAPAASSDQQVQGTKTVQNQTDSGIITKASQNSVDVTIERLEAAVKAKGLRVFTRIDHFQNAQNMGLEMRPTTLLIFGSPKIGAPLMSEQPTIGLDLPVKALAWQDEDGNVFLSYNDPAYLKQRHHIEKATAPLGKMAQALDGLTNLATAQ